MQNSERYYDYMVRKTKEHRESKQPDELTLLKERIKQLEIDVAHLQNKSIPELNYGSDI